MFVGAIVFMRRKVVCYCLVLLSGTYRLRLDDGLQMWYIALLAIQELAHLVSLPSSPRMQTWARIGQHNNISSSYALEERRTLLRSEDALRNAAAAPLQQSAARSLH